MSYAEVLYTVPEGLRKLFREYERIEKKLSTSIGQLNLIHYAKKKISCLIIQDYVIMTRQ